MKDDVALGAIPAPVAIEATAATRHARPHGKRFGILVHAVLATVALDADASAIADAARIRAASQRLPTTRSPPRVTRGRRARASSPRARACGIARRREAALMLLEPDGTIVEGVVDLAFYEAGAGWTVVDFKTDVEWACEETRMPAKSTRTRARFATATGEPARGALLAV